MADQNVLSDEELDALRDSGAEGDSASAGSDEPQGGGCRSYDFRDPSRILNGRLPGLDAVHETFAAGVGQALRTLLGRAVEVAMGENALTRLGDYQQSLPLPVSVHAAQLQGKDLPVLMVIDGSLVFACVDAFFGGRGSAAPGSGEREFSASERRISALLARHAFEELKNAWAPICTLRLAEPTPMTAGNMGAARDDQILVVSHFQVELNPGSGEFHLALPYPLLDGLRPYLTAGPRSEDASSDWRRRLGERVARVDVEARSVFQPVRISFAELVALRPGDFIPMTMQNRVTVMVDDQPLYVAEPGTSNGLAAAKVVARCDGAH